MYSGLLEVIRLYHADGDLEIIKKRLGNIEKILLERWSEVTVAYAKARLAIHS
jgi:hypothetical protein